MNRREFVAMMLAGGVVTAAGIWMPGDKLISIPSRKIFIPEGTLAWLDAGEPRIYQNGEIKVIPMHFDVDIRGFEVHRDLHGVTKLQA